MFNLQHMLIFWTFIFHNIVWQHILVILVILVVKSLMITVLQKFFWRQKQWNYFWKLL